MYWLMTATHKHPTYGNPVLKLLLTSIFHIPKRPAIKHIQDSNPKHIQGFKPKHVQDFKPEGETQNDHSWCSGAAGKVISKLEVLTSQTITVVLKELCTNRLWRTIILVIFCSCSETPFQNGVCSWKLSSILKSMMSEVGAHFQLVSFHL